MAEIRNLRDVGVAVNQLLGFNMLKEGTLFRSGELSQVPHPRALPHIHTIINLRRTPDPDFAHISNVNLAPMETMNNYLPETDIFKEWIQRIFDTLLRIKWPILMHCTAGKDRTGVLVAILLKNVGVPDQTIVDEYVLSEGQCYPESLQSLLTAYPKHQHLQMNRIDLDRLQELLCA